MSKNFRWIFRCHICLNTQVTGSGREQAAEILSTAQWQLQVLWNNLDKTYSIISVANCLLLIRLLSVVTLTKQLPPPTGVQGIRIQCRHCSSISNQRPGGGGIPWGTPSNTPATPPNFGEALAAFSALSTAQGELELWQTKDTCVHQVAS